MFSTSRWAYSDLPVACSVGTVLYQLCNRMGGCIGLERLEALRRTVFWFGVPVSVTHAGADVLDRRTSGPCPSRKTAFPLLCHDVASLRLCTHVVAGLTVYVPRGGRCCAPEDAFALASQVAAIPPVTHTGSPVPAAVADLIPFSGVVVEAEVAASAPPAAGVVFEGAR